MTTPRTSSLWLVPPEDSSLYRNIHSLILTSIPSLYPIAIPPRFTPHVTLTANTIPLNFEASDPQKWLDGLKRGDLSQLKVTIREPEVGNIFFQKLIILCEKTPELLKLAAHCRGFATGDVARAEQWVSENYKPHCSLMYSDLSQEEVQSKLQEVHTKIRAAQQSHPDATKAQGGSIWLVPTFKSIDEWQPIARRELSNVEWSWTS